MPEPSSPKLQKRLDHLLSRLYAYYEFYIIKPSTGCGSRRLKPLLELCKTGLRRLKPGF